MAYNSLKSIDAALDELETKEGLPDFIPLADEIGEAITKAFGSFKRDSLEKRKQRLEAARQGHDAEMKTIQEKNKRERWRQSPEGIEEHWKRCAELENAIESALASGDVEHAQISIDDLIVDCPDCCEIPAFVGDLQRISDAKEDETDRRKADKLGQVSNLSAVSTTAGNPSISLSWIKGKAALADSFQVERIDLSSGEKDMLPPLFDTQMNDYDVKLGIPYRYSIIPCYRSIPGKMPSVSEIVVCTAPISDFHETEAIGTANLGLVILQWCMPPFDPAAELAFSLERFHGQNVKSICLACDQEMYTDEDVVVGETYRYELTLIVAGKKLEPVMREVTVKALPELPQVKASSRQHRLIVEWPEGVKEICISSSLTNKSIFCTREDYGREPIPLPDNPGLSSFYIQAVYRFQTDKVVYGPKSPIISRETNRKVYVSIESVPKSGFKFWEKKEWGMKISLEGFEETHISELCVSVEYLDGTTKTFTLTAATEIQSGCFFKFPASWSVTSGAIIDVSLPPDKGKAYIEFQTSQEIP